jgi:hypothetical protein
VITDDTIRELKDLALASRQGPWTAHPCSWAKNIYYCLFDGDPHIFYAPKFQAEAKFITHMRKHALSLLDEIEKLKYQLAVLRGEK